MQAPPLPVTVTVLTVVAATNCVVDSVADCPGSIESIGLPGMMPSGLSSTVTLCTVVVPVLVIVYVYSTFPPPAGRSVLHSPVVPPQLSVPSVLSFRPTRVQSGDGAHLTPVVLSGLDASRQTGSQSARFVSGVALQEQLVCRISETPLRVTFVVAPGLVFTCAVAAMVKRFSLALMRTSPVLGVGGLCVADALDERVWVSV